MEKGEEPRLLHQGEERRGSVETKVPSLFPHVGCSYAGLLLILLQRISASRSEEVSREEPEEAADPSGTFSFTGLYLNFDQQCPGGT